MSCRLLTLAGFLGSMAAYDTSLGRHPPLSGQSGATANSAAVSTKADDPKRSGCR